jgi:hypothetical protein
VVGPANQQTTAPPVPHTGPREATPRTLHETAEPGRQATAPPVDKGGRHAGLVAGALAVLLIGTGVGVGGILLLGHDGRKHDTPTPAPTSAAPTARSSAPAVPARVMRAATPRSVRAVGKGPLAVLNWKLAKGNNYAILVEQADEIGEQGPQALPKHTLNATISGLDPSKGYCFVVGSIVALGQTDGQPASIAWSKPACIRGATAQ